MFMCTWVALKSCNNHDDSVMCVYVYVCVFDKVVSNIETNKDKKECYLIRQYTHFL